MENTSKALLIVAAVLVIILIITIGIKIFSSSSNVSKTSKDVGKTIDEKTAIAMGTMPSTSNSEIQERQVPTIDGTDSDNEEFENISLQQGQTAVENSPYISDGKKAIIPKGFTVSNVEGETSIDTGLVVRDSKNNEWVWIPVTSEDLLRMYVESNTGWKMSGTDVVTEYKRNYDVYTGKARATPGATGWKYREPDILVDTQDGDLRNTYNISNAGLGRNITEMATNLKNDYKNMIDSIKKYGGLNGYFGIYSCEALKKAINDNLTHTQKAVLDSIFDLSGSGLNTSSYSIGKRLNVTHQSITQCEARALESLAQPEIRKLYEINFDEIINDKLLTEEERQTIDKIQLLIEMISLKYMEQDAIQGYHTFKYLRLIQEELLSRRNAKRKE